VGASLRALGVEGPRIHAEHFSVATAAEGTGRAAASAAPAAAPSAPAAAPGGTHAEVTIVMDGRRRVFSMQMNSESVLDAAARAGIELPFSCRAGVCSTCRTKVVRGEVEMAQNYALEDWELEQGYVLACQSRVKSGTLELDYDEK
jgi:ring-1,2-phenylacetyl-CoA epoxidase subunit PaaE